MEEKTKNLCAQIPISLHDRVRRDQEAAGMTLSQFVTDLITKYYEGSNVRMGTNTRTLAFQVPEELYQRIKNYLAAESERTGKKLSQKEFVLGLIERALDEAESEQAE